MDTHKERDYEFIIQPNKSWFYFDWKGLSYYRDLLFFIVKRDFYSKYKQAVLGPFWFIISPLATTLVFTVVFGNMIKIPTDGMPPVLFYLCGLLAWRYFVACLNGTSDTLVSNAHLFGKVYFPRLIPPIAVVISNFFSFILELIVFLVFIFYFKFFTLADSKIQPNFIIFLLPLLVIQIAILSMGIGLWISALTAKYRDLIFLMGFLTQLWMYATPVIYPASMVSQKWRIFIVVNPMSSVVEAFRYAFLGVGLLRVDYLLFSAVATLVIFLSGLLVFNKAEKTFIDTV
ncbi:MAG: ABC transporter permease [Candidatus Omnitrophica bacterium]|nr:ABC transporter permease [Candidatus Omnitrophota bacterium]